MELWSDGPAQALPQVGYAVLRAGAWAPATPTGRAVRPQADGIPGGVCRHSTVMPIERAVPAMMRLAISTSFALRSCIFISAISVSWASVSVATLVLCGSPDPFSTPPAARMLLKAAGVDKGSGEPHKNKVATVTRDQVREIAQTKMEDLNASDIDQAAKIIAGTARSMGITVEA